MKSTNKIAKFKKVITELSIDINDDDKWPLIFQQLIMNLSLDEQYLEWEALLKFFILKEGKLGHCHKGNIYWSLGVIDFYKGNINETIDYLEKSAMEDKIKLNGEKRITASIGLLAVIKPLLHRYKSKKEGWEFDESVKSLYEHLGKEEKKRFADILLVSHTNFAGGKLKVILDNFFTFITDEKTRKITQDTYQELTQAVLNGVQGTYYSQIFALGSICEAIIDELFQRNDQQVWKLFKENQEIQKSLDKKSKMNKDLYASDLTLSQKVWMLRLMTVNGICPITKEAVLLLIIIGEYRDLIHPRRRLSFEFEVNRYVASVLIEAFSYIAGDLWPDNVKKIIESNYQLNNKR